jgi:hypothetical protein
MRQNYKKRIKIRFDAKVENSVPSETIQYNILSRSYAENLDDAKREWKIDSIIDETCEGFSDHCQLCNTPHLKHNFVLHNTKTGHTLAVGSTCIIRFKVIKGVVDVESGVTLLQNYADEYYLKNQIQTLANEMFVLRPDARVKFQFVKQLRNYMSAKAINNPSDEQLGELFFGPTWIQRVKDPYVLNRMRDLWYKPGYIETSKPQRIKRKSNPKEGSTFGHKRRTRVETTLSRSKAYRNH